MKVPWFLVRRGEIDFPIDFLECVCVCVCEKVVCVSEDKEKREVG